MTEPDDSKQQAMSLLTKRLVAAREALDHDQVAHAHQQFESLIGGTNTALRLLPDGDVLVSEWLTLPQSSLGPYINARSVPDSVWKDFRLAVQARMNWIATLLKTLRQPQHTADLRPAPSFAQADASDPSAVFVVHGRDRQARDAMFAFLRAIGLRPLEWSEAVVATGKASPYIGEILDTAFARARAIVVLMTGDDEACLRKQYQANDDPPHETDLTPQARANVIFEAGMALGRNPDRTVLVELGSLRPFSDIGGRHTLRFDNSTQRRQELAHRLETAGCGVNLKGVDWHTAGDFSPPMNPRQSRVLKNDVVDPADEVELSHEHHHLLGSV